ncbi:argininosuccinate synthase [Pantoea agglomerans]|uniref:Argininosuccinate synthase n=1 Tax=Enterobacter agglomerans TaxID=549 RepID=A0A379A9Z7_ENTAG|nr:argininosuccinate synthase [Pantoea agglomerans]
MKWLLQLYKGQATATQKRSANSLYSEEFATFGEDEVYDSPSCGRFIRLFSLSSRIRALKRAEEVIFRRGAPRLTVSFQGRHLCRPLFNDSEEFSHGTLGWTVYSGSGSTF